jgi:hypothetical protein
MEFRNFDTKSWLSNNILGSSMSVLGIELLALGDFLSSCILLFGLFFYDIFWVFASKPVFGANVMVTVAKSFDGPIKLIFPKVYIFSDSFKIFLLNCLCRLFPEILKNILCLDWVT